jgi:hypothetical protein
MKRIYAAGVCEERKTMDVWNTKIDVNLVWADGQIGAMPVFKTKRAAQKYLGKTKAPLITLEMEERKEA